MSGGGEDVTYRDSEFGTEGDTTRRQLREPQP